MSLPVRCFSCNNIIGHFEQKFLDMLTEEKEEGIKDFLNENNIEKYCCRRMFLGYVPTRHALLQYPPPQKIVEEYARYISSPESLRVSSSEK